MDIGIAALSEVRTPESGEIMAGGYTHYWSGRSDGNRAQGVAAAVSNKLTPMIIIEVTPVTEHIMRLRFVTPWVSFPWSLYMLRTRRVISP